MRPAGPASQLATATRQDPFTGSCKRHAGFQDGTPYYTLLGGQDRACPHTPIRAPVPIVHRPFVLCLHRLQGSSSWPHVARARTRPAAVKLPELLRAWPRGASHHQLTVSRGGGNAQKGQPPPGTRRLDILELCRPAHTSAVVPLAVQAATPSRVSTKVIRPSVLLRQDPAVRIPHSHSWCGAVGSSPPQGQEFQVQTDPPAWGRQRQITACA